ncbi:MAG: DUF1223 domain-containing protein [Taibaiella sp.]|nr:DUF1223 domain-containing protein [Taibaiella sp.]
MQKVVFHSVTVITMCIAVIFFASGASAQKPLAVVELFTSEGCSSCPAADRAVEDLQVQHKNDVLVLCYHVDYWNYLGWKDIYSSPANTRRQQFYTGIFHLNGAYTPQAVVNGTSQFTGSDRQQLAERIKRPLSFGNKLIIKARATDGKIEVTNTASRLQANEAIVICLVQKESVSQVKSGENSGHRLHHINLVRDYQLTGANVTARLTVPSGINKDALFVAAYIQNTTTGAIQQCATIEVE